MEHIGLFALAALIVGASKGGLASAGALAVPLLSLWMDPLRAAGTLLPIYIVSDVVGVWLFRRDYSRQNLAVLIPAGLAGVILATFVAPLLSVALTTFLVGLIGFAYSAQVAVRVIRRAPPLTRPFDARRGVFWGVLTGMTSFISHTGAPPFQAFVLPQRLEKMTFAGTTTITFAAINLFKLPSYAAVGMLSAVEPALFAVMAAVAVGGVVLGKRLSHWLPDRVYRAIIEGLLAVLSVWLMVDGALKGLG
ncbi:MAG: sulfite exporter TauE/SafE family protein [Mangrovicoccus sp.]|nr:sulfite exporter TauE/SafE family protein [Mangrovicoccus sp.]